MIYLRILWIHNHKNEPTVFYLELDKNRYEMRRIDVYSDKKKFYISKRESYGEIGFSEFPTPSIKEIEESSSKGDSFKAYQIDKDEFEKKWNKAIKQNLKD